MGFSSTTDWFVIYSAHLPFSARCLHPQSGNNRLCVHIIRRLLSVFRPKRRSDVSGQTDTETAVHSKHLKPALRSYRLNRQSQKQTTTKNRMRDPRQKSSFDIYGFMESPDLFHNSREFFFVFFCSVICGVYAIVMYVKMPQCKFSDEVVK